MRGRERSSQLGYQAEPRGVRARVYPREESVRDKYSEVSESDKNVGNLGFRLEREGKDNFAEATGWQVVRRKKTERE